MFPSTFSRSRRSRSSRHTGRALCASIAPCVESLEVRQFLSATATPAVTNPGGAPNAPFGLSATATGPTAVQFSFYDSADNETGFTISRSSGGGAFSRWRRSARPPASTLRSATPTPA